MTNGPVVIKQVKNGFIVSPIAGQHMIIEDGETVVFESIAALNEHLAKYFRRAATQGESE